MLKHVFFFSSPSYKIIQNWEYEEKEEKKAYERKKSDLLERQHKLDLKKFHELHKKVSKSKNPFFDSYILIFWVCSMFK